MSKNVNIKINADSSNANKGINQVTSKLNKFSKQAKSSSFSNLATSFMGATKAISIVTEGVKKAIRAIKDLNEVALVQIKAEKQLETAAKNNPYLNKESVSDLKKYASNLQKIGTIGDETLLPLMAQLAAQGRNQEEIQNIMSAALDVSASEAMSLDSAVKNLSKTYGGMTGELGELLPETKSLSVEQLKNGDAVAIVAKKYKGMSKDIADSTGSGKQFKNAWGDLKEALGTGFIELIRPTQQYFTQAVEWATSLIGKMNEFLGLVRTGDYIKPSDKIKAELESISKTYEEIKAQNEKTKKELSEQLSLERKIGINEETRLNIENGNEKIIQHKNELTSQLISDDKIQKKLIEEINSLENNKENKKSRKEKLKELKDTQKEIKNIQVELESLSTDEQNGVKTSTTLLNKKAEQEQLMANLNEKRELLQEKYNVQLAEEKSMTSSTEEISIIEKSNEALEAELKKIEEKYNLELKLNGKIDEQSYHQERLNAMTDSYLALITDSNGIVTEDSAIAEKRISQLQKEDENLKACCKSQSEYDELINKWVGEKTTSQLEQLQQELILLEEYKQKLGETGDVGQNEFNKINDAIKNIKNTIQNTEFSELIENVKSVTDTVESSIQSLNDSVQAICNTAISQNTRETENAQDDLKDQYENGIISYEEYQDQKNELDKEAAQKEYKIKMAQWTMNLAMATAQSAQAVVNALASGTPPLNIINGVAAGILGAAQIATIAGSKPKAPSFSTGGFLMGTSTSGDKIPFMGNAGEAILNPAEQRNFMDMANGNITGGVIINMPIQIENNSDATVTAQQDDQLIRITIDKQVNASMKNGTYNNSMAIAENSKRGVKLL